MYFRGNSPKCKDSALKAEKLIRMFTFVQEEMREHLIACFETGQMTPFPVLK